jgi:hypothetical protein
MLTIHKILWFWGGLFLFVFGIVCIVPALTVSLIARTISVVVGLALFSSFIIFAKLFGATNAEVLSLRDKSKEAINRM